MDITLQSDMTPLLQYVLIIMIQVACMVLVYYYAKMRNKRIARETAAVKSEAA